MANQRPQVLLAQQPTLSRLAPPAAIAANRLRPQARYVLNGNPLPQNPSQTPPLRPSFLNPPAHRSLPKKTMQLTRPATT